MAPRKKASPQKPSKRAVATVVDATQTGRVVRFLATSAEQSRAAAAPSLTGQIS